MLLQIDDVRASFPLGLGTGHAPKEYPDRMHPVRGHTPLWPPFTRKPLLGTIAVTRQLNDAQEELALQELRTGRVPAGCAQVRRDPHTDTTTFALGFEHAAVVGPCPSQLPAWCHARGR